MLENKTEISKKVNRNVQIDAARAFSVVYIVGYWHIFNYTNAFPGYFNDFTVRLTVCILGLFVLISGYFSNFEFKKIEGNSVKNFYWKKLRKIYPPYFFALLIFGIFKISDIFNLIKAALLISMFYIPAPPTLWFMTMIIFFYVITPIFIIFRDKSVRFLISGALFFLALVIYGYETTLLDTRVAIYFPCYLLGIILARRNFSLNKNIIPVLILFFGVAVYISFLDKDNVESSYFSVPLAFSGALIIFLMFLKMKITRCLSFISLMSASSYFIYLFHRPLLTAMKKIYFPEMGLMQIFYLLFICFPVVVYMSYKAQMAYSSH